MLRLSVSNGASPMTFQSGYYPLDTTAIGIADVWTDASVSLCIGGGECKSVSDALRCENVRH